MAGDVPDALGADEGLDPFSFYYEGDRSTYPIGKLYYPQTLERPAERIHREKYGDRPWDPKRYMKEGSLRLEVATPTLQSLFEAAAGGPRLKLVRTGTTDVVGSIPRPGEITGNTRHFSVEKDRRLTTAEGLRHDPYENPFGPVPSPVRHFVLCYGLVTFDGGWTLERVLEVPPGFEMSLLEGIEGWQTSSS